jgi:hypothetical protein
MISPPFSDLTTRSPAPEANENLAKAKFYSEIAKAKNALASGVRCTGWFGFFLSSSISFGTRH